MKEYGISLNHARTLTGDFKLANFFEKWAKLYLKKQSQNVPIIQKQEPNSVPGFVPSSWVADTLIGELNYREMGFDEILSDNFDDQLAELILLIDQDRITDKSAIEILRVMLDHRLKKEPAESPITIVQRLNLAKTTGDDSAIMTAIEETIKENPKALEDYRAGKGGALNFLVGQVMKKTRGKADPAELNRMLSETLKKKEA
jgi:aspartyl-tRNA(Asn)/glutamyl-tRNA(Gln) amidotransferase subunit B